MYSIQLPLKYHNKLCSDKTNLWIPECYWWKNRRSWLPLFRLSMTVILERIVIECTILPILRIMTSTGWSIMIVLVNFGEYYESSDYYVLFRRCKDWFFYLQLDGKGTINVLHLITGTYHLYLIINFLLLMLSNPLTFQKQT
jgi:hypothetical protein